MNKSSLIARRRKNTVQKPLLIFLCLYMPYISKGKNELYNLDIHNGLPSSHIYGILIDRNGYLWMATPQGVVRYNGYETKIFNLSDGLVKKDIWQLYEDNKGRIWLLCICRTLGYIYDNEFKAAVMDNAPPALYPRRIWNYDSGIFLYSLYDINATTNKVYIEKNDTLYGLSVESGWDISYLWNEKNKLFYTRKVTLGRRTHAAYDIYSLEFVPGKITKRLHYKITEDMSGDREAIFVDNHVYYYTPFNKELTVLNTQSNLWKTIHLDSIAAAGRFTKLSPKDLYLRDGADNYWLNDSLQLIAKYTLSDFIPYSSVSIVLHDIFWGNCIATKDNGIFISYNEAGYFQHVAGLAGTYKYFGHSLNGIHFWWDRYTNKMAFIQPDGKAVYHQLNKHVEIRRVAAWSNTQSILVDMNVLYLLDHKTGTLTPLLKGKKIVSATNKSVIETIDDIRVSYLDVAVVDTNNLFVITRAAGVSKLSLKNGICTLTLIEGVGGKGKEEPYAAITYDPLQKSLWTYRDDIVVKYNKDGNSITMKAALTGAYGIRNVEKILVDEKYGNILLKEFDRLLLFNIHTHQYQEVHRNLNLENSQVSLYKDLLIVAGRFGIVFNKITGPNKLSAPVLYENIKDQHYKDMMDIQTASDNILLNTDKGMIQVPVPDSNIFYKQDAVSQQTTFKFLLGYNKVWKQVLDNDTLLLDQENKRLQFDVIRPSGNGVLKYSYRIQESGAAWEELNGKELTLSILKPGHFYTLSIKMRDQVWQSDEMYMHIYVVPYWWQTPIARQTMWVLGILGFLLLVWCIIFITRRTVMRNNLKKNMHMEMELKSIYSQINPHFIFNTLTSALLLIKARKNQEAYLHVSKFSRLLRAYIKSSRNRLITVEEEMENLKNYIELQQIRFKGKFDYEITVKGGVETQRIRIPSLLLQPIVENAINHGLFHKEEKGRLEIHFEQGVEEGEITCTIEDDGIGRQQAKQIKNESALKTESYGDQLIEDLIRIFNKYEKQHIGLQYIDKELPLTGTIVKLNIKRSNEK